MVLPEIIHCFSAASQVWMRAQLDKKTIFMVLICQIKGCFCATPFNCIHSVSQGKAGLVVKTCLELQKSGTEPWRNFRETLLTRTWRQGHGLDRCFSFLLGNIHRTTLKGEAYLAKRSYDMSHIERVMLARSWRRASKRRWIRLSVPAPDRNNIIKHCTASSKKNCATRM